MSNGIRVKQKVRVGAELADGRIVQFFCRIEKIFSDRLILILAEQNKEFGKFLVEGHTVRLSIYTPIGIILMNSIVLSTPQNVEFEVEYVHTHKRIQRRRYVRANANYRLIIVQGEKPMTALTADIGGGGIRFICDEAPKLSFVSAKLFIPEMPEGIAFSGDIEKRPYYKQNEYLIQFNIIDESDRNKIIQKCLALEAKSIRNKINE